MAAKLDETLSSHRTTFYIMKETYAIVGLHFPPHFDFEKPRNKNSNGS